MKPELDGSSWLGAALSIARDLCPNAELSWIASEFDALAEPLSASDLSRLSPERQAEEIGTFLYGLAGFSGPREEPEDPRQSLLHEVLRRRQGLPIALALVYLEVARRVGVEAQGVCFPGHFLIKVVDRQRTAGVDRGVWVDPCTGDVLDPEDQRWLAKKMTGSLQVDPEWLSPSTSRGIVIRMLSNLRQVFQRRGEWSSLLVVLGRLCEVNPGSPPLWRDRGLLLARLGAPRAALTDLERYLSAVSAASDRGSVAQVAVELRRRLDSGSAESAKHLN